MTLELVIDLTSADAEDDGTLVSRAWEGDEQALGTLLDRYRGFVRGKARSYFLAGADREDVVQEGMIGLYKAIRDFDPSRQASFRAFADLCVTRQIITAVKSATRHKHSPLNTYISFSLPAHGEDSDVELADTIAVAVDDPCEHVVAGHDLAELERWFGEILSELEAEVLQRYVGGESYAEIAVAMDRHVKSIDNALQRIKRKLDGYLQARALEPAV